VNDQILVKGQGRVRFRLAAHIGRDVVIDVCLSQLNEARLADQQLNSLPIDLLGVGEEAREVKEVFPCEERLLVDLQKGERELDHGEAVISEDEIPDPGRAVQGEAVEEQAKESLADPERHLDLVRGEVLVQFGERLLDCCIEDELVELDGRRVVFEVAEDQELGAQRQAHEKSESLGVTAPTDNEDEGHDEVHPLAVANAREVHGDGLQHLAEAVLTDLVLKERVVGVGPMDVALNLLAAGGCLLEDAVVLAGVVDVVIVDDCLPDRSAQRARGPFGQLLHHPDLLLRLGELVELELERVVEETVGGAVHVGELLHQLLSLLELLHLQRGLLFEELPDLEVELDAEGFEVAIGFYLRAFGRQVLPH